MRSGLDAGTLALYTGGAYDSHVRLKVENGSGTLINLEGRYHELNFRLPDPDEPIGSLTVGFVRETTEQGSLTSLAPLVTTSSYNKLDDGTTYSPLLQLGRQVTLEVALTAVGGARPADGSTLWYEVFRGVISSVRWPKYDTRTAGISVKGLGGALTKSETAYTYLSGTSIEDTAQEILTNNKFTGVNLYFPVATGKVLSADYAPGIQKTVWSQLWDLAQSIGWLCFFQYRAQLDIELTFFEPARTKVISDMTVVADDFNALNVTETEVRNVGYLLYYDVDGVEHLIGPDEDSASIGKYGGSLGIRRPFWIKLERTSPVRDLTDATEMLAAALSDVSDPDVVATVNCVPLWFGENGIDLYTFPENIRFFEGDQEYAPFSNRINVPAEGLVRSALGVRGIPTAGSQTWKKLGRPSTEVTRYAEGEAKLIVNNSNQAEMRIDTGGNTFLDRAYYAISVNPVDESIYPTVDDESAFVERANLPYQAVLDDPGNPGNPLGLSDGDVVLLKVRYWNTVDLFGGESTDRLDFNARANTNWAQFTSLVLTPANELLQGGSWKFDTIIQLGSAVKSIRVVVEDDTSTLSAYNFNMTGGGEHTLRQSNGTDILVVDGSDGPFTITITPYNAVGGASGSGTPGTQDQIVTQGTAEESGLAMRFQDQDGVQRTGEKTKLDTNFDVVYETTGDFAPVLKDRSAQAVTPGTTLDWNNGGMQTFSLSAAKTITDVLNFTGVSLNLRVTGLTGTNVLTFSGAKFEAPSGVLATDGGANGIAVISILNFGTTKYTVLIADNVS